jgi:hypothetical protein
MEKEEQGFVVKFFWLKGWGSKKIHQKLMGTLADDAYWLSRLKSGYRGSEPGIFHVVTFLMRDDHPSLYNCRLRHFSKSILLHVPA